MAAMTHDAIINEVEAITGTSPLLKGCDRKTVVSRRAAAYLMHRRPGCATSPPAPDL